MSRESREHLMALTKFQKESWNKIIPKEFHDYLYTEEDIEEIKNWDNKKSDIILNKILEFVFDQEVGSIDWSTNPICQYNDVICQTCNYGKRHGICDNKGSNRRELQSYFRTTEIDEFNSLSNNSYRKFFKSRGLKFEVKKEKNRKEA